MVKAWVQRLPPRSGLPNLYHLSRAAKVTSVSLLFATKIQLNLSESTVDSKLQHFWAAEVRGTEATNFLRRLAAVPRGNPASRDPNSWINWNQQPSARRFASAKQSRTGPGSVPDFAELLYLVKMKLLWISLKMWYTMVYHGTPQNRWSIIFSGKSRVMFFGGEFMWKPPFFPQLSASSANPWRAETWCRTAGAVQVGCRPSLEWPQEEWHSEPTCRDLQIRICWGHGNDWCHGNGGSKVV